MWLAWETLAVWSAEGVSGRLESCHVYSEDVGESSDTMVGEAKIAVVKAVVELTIPLDKCPEVCNPWVDKEAITEVT